DLAVANAELESGVCRADALRAKWDGLGVVAERAKAVAAIRAERESAVAKARHSIAGLNLRLARAPTDQKEPIAKKLASAHAALARAEKLAPAAIAPAGTFTGIVGAQWAATRFLNSAADDPAVTFPTRSTGRRTALALWITDPRNPLTARVAVNHLWARHFGRPLVETVFDFGRKGTPPSHHALLDWLAVEFMENGWSLKHLHRLIVTSEVYRLSAPAAGADPRTREADPENRWYWRRNPLRMEAQVLRDSLLHLAGELDPRIGGPSVPVADEGSRRRALYFVHSNNDQNKFL